MAKSKSASLGFILAPAHHGAGALSRKLNTHPDILSLDRDNSAAVAPEAFLDECPQILNDSKFNIWLNGAVSLMANEFSQRCWGVFYEQAEEFLQKQESFLSTLQLESPHKIFMDAQASNIKFMTMASMGFPVTGAVHVTRDPRGYAAAYKKECPDVSPEKMALEWASTHTRIKRLKSFFSKIPFLTIRYEDFIAKPDETSLKIARHMGLPETGAAGAENANSLENKLLGTTPQDMNPECEKPTENWRKSLHPEDQSRVLAAAGPLFAEFGYKP